MWFRRLVRELHRRSVWQVGGVFLATSWVVLQVVEVLTESAGLPAWFPAFAFGLLALGLPFVLATAFMQEGLSPPPDEDGDGVPDYSGPGPDGLRRVFTWRNALTGGVGAALAAGVVAVGWLLLSERAAVTDEGAPSARRSVAVLPFTLVGGSGPDDESFAYGMHDELLTRLSQIEGLRVTSRTSVVQYADDPKPIPVIGEELGVEAVLEGGIQRSGGRVRINVQLIDAVTDEHLWAETYQRDFEDVFALQAELTTEVATALQGSLAPDEARRVAERPTDDIAAYELVLQAQGFSFLEREENEAGIRLFRRAVALDPEYGGALNGLAWRYAYRSAAHGYPREWLDSAMVLAEAALTAGDELGALNTIGFVHSLRGEAAEAVDAWRAGLEIAPSSASVLGNLSSAETFAGDVRQGLPHAWRTVLVDPNSHFSWWWLGLAEFALGREERGLAWVEEAFDREPGFYWPSYFLVWSGGGDAAARDRALAALRRAEPDGLATLISETLERTRSGEHQEAARAARRLLDVHPDGATIMASAQGTAALALAAAGHTGEAEALLESLRAAVEPRLESGQLTMEVYELGATQLLLGQRQSALESFRRLADAGLLFPGFWERSYRLLGIDGDPEFEAILDGIRARAAEEADAADARLAGLDPLPGVVDPRSKNPLRPGDAR